MERLTVDDEERAVALFSHHADEAYSLFDASSFVVMERLGVTRALAFDSDFRSYGRFEILP